MKLFQVEVKQHGFFRKFLVWAFSEDEAINLACILFDCQMGKD